MGYQFKEDTFPLELILLTNRYALFLFLTYTFKPEREVKKLQPGRDFFSGI